MSSWGKRFSMGTRGLKFWALIGVVLVLAIAAFAAGCGGGDETSATTSVSESSTTTAAPVESSTTTAPAESTTTTAAEADVQKETLILASTTSTKDSGLFDVLIPAFTEVLPRYDVKVVAVGSGEALKMGETGDADVLLVHSPAAEETFMKDGFGVERKAVMYNDFVIVGPADDPAKIKGTTSAADALKAIAAAKAAFFTRNDNSGTYTKELSLWKAAGITPSGSWYQSTGQGMGETLTIADQKGGYTLADRGTYLSKKDSLKLEILTEGDQALFNQYHVITVKDANNFIGASTFLYWITSPSVQKKLIGTYGTEKFGQPLFVPNAG